MIQGLVPNCAYTHEQAMRINGLNIVGFVGQLRDFDEQRQQLSENRTHVTNILADEILRHIFIAEEMPQDDGSSECIAGGIAFIKGEAAHNFLSSGSENTQYMLDLLYVSREKIESEIERHVRIWHRNGRERCYRSGRRDSPGIVVLAAARQVGDVLFRHG